MNESASASESVRKKVYLTGASAEPTSDSRAMAGHTAAAAHHPQTQAYGVQAVLSAPLAPSP